MLINEVAERKAKKEAQDYLLKNCMGKTVKEAHTILFGDEFLKLYDIYLSFSFNFEIQNVEMGKSGELDIILEDLHNIFIYSFFNDIFKSVWAGQHLWNCGHFGYNCDYVLTKEDLKPTSWP